MIVSCRLKDVASTQAVASDGLTLETKLQNFAESVVTDIQNCANLCDTYVKQHPVARVLKAVAWHDELLDCMDTLSVKRNELQFALTIHFTSGGSSAQTLASDQRLMIPLHW